MSSRDPRTVVTSYDDLTTHSKISSAGADMIASLLNSGVAYVVYIPVWLADDNDLDPVTGGQTLYVGSVEDYSAKAWLFSQDDQSVFLPKSQVHVFEKAVETIDTPQSALESFETGDHP